MRISRLNRSFIGDWWWTVDRRLLACALILITIGLLGSLAASPFMAIQRGLPTYYFVTRHTIFAMIGLVLLVGISSLPIYWIKRFSLLMLSGAVGAVIMTILVGKELNGATRWLSIFGFSIQPSEFIKPAFAISVAWLLAQKGEYQKQYFFLSCVLLASIGGLFLLQPDVGQLVLLTGIWGIIFFMSGARWKPLLAIGLMALPLAWFIYQNNPHVQQRFDQYLGTSSLYGQEQRALNAIQSGGLVGVGPGNGQIKEKLPESHTDYIFAVLVEEYGLVVGVMILGIFFTIIYRVFTHIKHIRNYEAQLAITGLGFLLVMQAIINIAVNLSLIPSKGMTLPFVSAGGSSLIASAITIGMLLALTRSDANNDTQGERLW